MRGFVPTPEPIVDAMVEKLFEGRRPGKDATILDPGCGPGAFIAGMVRWAEFRRSAVPQIVGVELEPGRARAARDKFADRPSITIRRADFLAESQEQYDFVIGNPPYVSIGHLAEAEKLDFRQRFETATGRFDLYVLFFEQALRRLKPGGRLVFITPEKFLYVQSAASLRRLLGTVSVREIRLVDEETFGSLVTYPTITVIDKQQSDGLTRFELRDGSVRSSQFPTDGRSLLPLLHGQRADEAGPTLDDLCVRVSCGVATGADEVFVHPEKGLNSALRRFSYPTVSGRQLSHGSPRIGGIDRILVPYSRSGDLVGLDDLGPLRGFLLSQRDRLARRTCTRRKPWFAFHDSVPLPEILRPKILCKDITEKPAFWVDRKGELVPRHSVYYVVPKPDVDLAALAGYLNSAEARTWLQANCQRAANGFLRLQSSVLKRLPVPPSLLA